MFYNASPVKTTKKNPNPHGKHGKPIILPPTTFEDAVKKMLNTPAPSKQAPKKTTKRKATS
jgi:hypothetical protein